MIDAVAIAALLPHGSGLSLLDAITFWDEATLRASSRRHLRPTHPLGCARVQGANCLKVSVDEVSSVQLIEYAAQAAGVHIRLLAPAEKKLRGGVLAMVRDIKLNAETLGNSNAELNIEVVRRGSLGLGLLYDFVVTRAFATLASGKLGIVLRVGDS